MLRIVGFNKEIYKNKYATNFQNKVGFFGMLQEIRSSKRKKRNQLASMASVFFKLCKKSVLKNNKKLIILNNGIRFILKCC